MTAKAVLIGINYIGTENELHGCINDIVHMKQFLQEDEFFGNSITKFEIRMLTDASNDQSLIPTKTNIINAFKWLVEGATDKSHLFLHYSGHGGAIPDYGPEADNNQDSTICPLDFATSGQIKDKDLRKILVDPLPAGCKMNCIFDSCHSGTILDLKYNWVGHPKLPESYSRLVDKHPDSKADVMVLSGCMDKQTSADAFEDNVAQGALTYAFLQTVKKCRGKSRVEMKCDTLLKAMHKFLADKQYDQIPVISCGRSSDLDQTFISILPESKPRWFGF